MGSSFSTEAGCVLDGMEGEPAYPDHVLSANELDRMDGLDTSELSLVSAAASPRAAASLTFSPPSAAPGAHGSLSDSGERTLHDWQLEQGTPADSHKEFISLHSKRHVTKQIHPHPMLDDNADDADN